MFIIMDEPTSAISDKEVETLLEPCAQILKEDGKGIIYISHKFEEIFRIADEATVFRDGKHIATVNVAETTQGELVQMMTGKETGGFPAKRVRLPVRCCSRLKTCRARTNLTDISFSLHKGEILGDVRADGRGQVGAFTRAFWGEQSQQRFICNSTVKRSRISTLLTRRINAGSPSSPKTVRRAG